jgi:hypothetical protein
VLRLSPHRPIVAPVATAVACVLLLVPGFARTGFPMDEGQLLAYPELVGRGAIANLDFESSYGPANLWLLALVFRVFGAGVASERAVGLAYRLLIVAGVWAFALALGGDPARGRHGRRGAACVAALTSAALLAGSGCCAFAWFGGMAAALWSLYALARGVAGADERALALAGALAGTALAFRLDLAPAVALSALPLAAAASARGRLAYGAGLGIGLAPLAAHVARIGTERAWRTLFVETVLLAGPGRRLPIPPHGLLSATLFGTAVLAAAALLLLAARMAAAQPMSPRVRAWLALAALSLGALPQLLQRADSLHAIDAACVSLPLAPIAALPLAGRFARRAHRALALVGVVVAVAAAGVGVAAGLAGARWLEQGGRRFPLPPALAASLAPVLREIDGRAAAGDTLFVGPRDLRRTNYGDTFVYFMLPRLRPASYYTEMNPGVANAPGSSLARDIERADFLILTDRFDDWNEPNASARLGPAAPLRVVEDRFCRLLRSGHFELRERCDRRAE